MDTYSLMRAFADSWGLLAMFLFFIGAIAFVFLRPGSRQAADDAAAIPFKED
jgi:cytochrome c oxidase cbb3-type subunit IV